jgi:flagellar hook-associated protein FlgK
VGLTGGTPPRVGGWRPRAYRPGRAGPPPRDARDSRAEIVRMVEALRDQAAGVSLDEEAAHLLKFQRAYEANAKFFTIVDDTLSVLLNLV